MVQNLVIMVLICFYTLKLKQSEAMAMEAGINKRSKENEGRIVGGGFANIKKYPHSAFLSIQNYDGHNEETSWMCGSSIINQFILLTAAHCVEECVPGTTCYIIATVGNIDKYSGDQVSVDTFKMHEKYDSHTVENDISLLKLLKPLKMGQTVSRVTIINNLPRNEAASLAGWGVFDEYTEMDSDTLKHLTDIELMGREECIKLILVIPEGAFCARRAQDDNNYAAEGDSGSALIIRGFIQIGVVSFKNPEFSRSIIVYTDVAKYSSWIRDSATVLFCGHY